MTTTKVLCFPNTSEGKQEAERKAAFLKTVSGGEHNNVVYVIETQHVFFDDGGHPSCPAESRIGDWIVLIASQDEISDQVPP